MLFRAWDGETRPQSVGELRPHFLGSPGGPDGSGPPGPLISRTVTYHVTTGEMVNRPVAPTYVDAKRAERLVPLDRRASRSNDHQPRAPNPRTRSGVRRRGLRQRAGLGPLRRSRAMLVDERSKTPHLSFPRFWGVLGFWRGERAKHACKAAEAWKSRQSAHGPSEEHAGQDRSRRRASSARWRSLRPPNVLLGENPAAV
jgi:hypothetical protein